MKILIHSPAFLPQIGGLEINMATMAAAFAAAGHEVTVWTTTPARGSEPVDSYQVVRRPGALATLRLVRWCDVLMHANLSLRGMWPLLLVRRPWVVSHHSWYRRTDGSVAWQDRLKRWSLRYASGSISVSRALADDLSTPSIVIPNAYRDRLFRILADEPRRADLLFVGRLVSDKGVDVLLESLALLKSRACTPKLTIVGEGPEAPRLAAQARRLELEAQIVFAGAVQGEDLVREMNRHAVMVVPSRYDEPFGIVALEGIASGCVLVGTRGGGLVDAIGPCGLTVPNGDAEALAAGISRALTDATLRETWRAAAPAHLHMHSLASVTAANLRVLEAARQSGGHFG